MTSNQSSQTPSRHPIAVLVMAYGGPAALEELPGYLSGILNGRVVRESVSAEIIDHYQQIGGRSPLPALTRAQVAAIAEQFDPDRVKFYLGMRHWSPWIEDVVGQMIEDGITHAVSLVMAPQYSRMSIAKYHQKIKSGLQMYRGQIDFEHIKSYHDAPKLIRALASRVNTGLGRWAADERKDVHVVFSAHSLPVRIIKAGDLYADQVQETAQLVAEQAGLSVQQWSLSYQSAGRSAEPWLGPPLEKHLTSLAGQGVAGVVSVPIGFVCDHVEILYDIDIKARSVIAGTGMRLERPPALNTDPLFIEQLVELIEAKVELLESSPTN